MKKTLRVYAAINSGIIAIYIKTTAIYFKRFSVGMGNMEKEWADYNKTLKEIKFKKTNLATIKDVRNLIQKINNKNFNKNIWSVIWI